MTLRPEELVRKTVVAGYGNPAGSVPSAVHHDDTCALSSALTDLELGDWCAVAGLDGGHLTAWEPTQDGASDFTGVATHAARSGQIVRVKTCGAVIAKIKPNDDVSVGDFLQVVQFQRYAEKYDSGCPCGRFLGWVDSGHTLGWVVLGDSLPDVLLKLHHHNDSSNTMVRDRSSVGQTLNAPLWHVWKVTNIEYTGEDGRLMHALGGGSSHGESPKEGWGWAGIIGQNAKMGFGQIGGNETSGNQGVLGAENPQEGVGEQFRVNVRSWAGFNARDRYGFFTSGATPNPVVAPIRFTFCEDKQAVPKWYVPDGCDCMTGITPSEPCTGDLWWAGTMRLDSTVDPSGPTSTDWHQQWVPQFKIERDCCEANYAVATPPDYPCAIFTNVSMMESNAYNVSGAYEQLIPYGYTQCTGRLDVLKAACYHSEQIIALWRTIMGGFGTVSQLLACIDANLVALGRPACCGTVPAATVPTVSGGPSVKTCAASDCDAAP